MKDKFIIADFCYSNTAKAKGIDNTKMTGDQLCNLMDLYALLCELEKELSKHFNTRITINITNAFRSKELNDYFITTIGASKTSEHLEGKASDCQFTGATIKEVFNAIKELADNNVLNMGQVILEYGSNPDSEKDDWIHISTVSERHINEFMIATPIKGKVVKQYVKV